MQREVRLIPAAPRRVRISPLLAHRWPLLFSGGVMVVLGTLIAWAMFLQSGGKLSFGPRLEAGPTRLVQATITEVRQPTHFDGRAWNQVLYEFQWEVQDQQQVSMWGMSFAPVGMCEIGAEVAVHVLEEDPNISCVVGGVKHMHRQWLYARFWLVASVVPGALILLTWLAGVFQLRRVLVHGDVSVGRVLDVKPVQWILPQMLAVTYEFRDHRAKLRKNRHWVRVHGALGERLRLRGRNGREDTLPVLHDRQMPHWNRMLLPQDFLLTVPDSWPTIEPTP